MKLSVLHTKDDQYRFAVTVDGVHRTVAALPTLTQAMHLTLAELKAAVAQALGTHLDLFQRIVISPCSISAILYSHSGPAVLAVNSTGDDLSKLGLS